MTTLEQDIEAVAAKAEEDIRIGDYWAGMDEANELEPIHESEKLDALKTFMIAYLRDGGQNNFAEGLIFDTLMNGAREYILECMPEDEGEPLKPGSLEDEESFDSRERAKDINATIRMHK